MTPHTVLGSVLLASASECGSIESLARELGISRQALAHLVSGVTPSLPTFRAVVRFLGVPADEVLAMMDAPDDGQPWQPDHAAGGRARMGGLCEDCASALARRGASARWAVPTDERQMTISEVA